jgi:hypothetical protein
MREFSDRVQPAPTKKEAESVIQAVIGFLGANIG